MALIGDILGVGGAANLGTALIDTLGKLIPDKDAAEKAKTALQEQILQIEADNAKAQTQVDNTEAASTNWFVASWRPLVGYTCASGLAYQFILFPFIVWASLNFGWKSPPALDLETLNTLLFGMLGMTAARTAEKFKGVAGDH